MKKLEVESMTPEQRDNLLEAHDLAQAEIVKLHRIMRDSMETLGKRDIPTDDIADDFANVVQGHCSCHLVRARAAELEAERQDESGNHNRYVRDAGRIVTRLEKENALLRKAQRLIFRAGYYRGHDDGVGVEQDCGDFRYFAIDADAVVEAAIDAALARIPEAGK